MDHQRYERPPSRRKPLTDATFRSNKAATSPLYAKAKDSARTDALTSSPNNLPHNEFIVPNGSLTIGHQQDSSLGNKRVSAVSNEYHNKRDSEISNASTASRGGGRRKTHIGPWQLGKTIGRGGCSRVRVVRHSTTQQYGAAKIISKAVAEKVRALSLANLIKEVEMEEALFPGAKIIPFGLEREIVIMKLLEHRNIVKLYDVWENRNELYLIMEYVQGGELFNYIEEQGGLQEIEVVHLFRQIIAALIYCHRIHIHHRDLKPENILLDKSTFEIKLVDFGMAAMQPEGKKLSTPCGSPHYAAPEVIRFKAYDGGKADVWSCGVILYVMLTGTPPFNYSGDERDLKDLFRAIAQADYIMPDTISKEAQDLISKILVPDPSKRIDIDAIWAHPFLHKYDSQLSFEGENSKKESWIGPRPRIEDWKPLARHDIDREILRNMRTLWHSVREEDLVQKLLNKEGNQEKFFYSALVKHREEHLENYAPSPGGVGYSASDYHHNRPARAARLLQPPNAQRSQSQYSIMNDEHLYSKHSFYEPPPSDASYDPFRASRDPLVSSKAYVNVTVLRGSSNGSHRTGTGMGERQRSSLRIQTLKNTRRRSSGLSSAMSSKGASSPTAHRVMAAAKRRSMSRGSMASSLYPSSPPVAIVARPNSSVKRNVSFSHLRRNSTVSALTADLQYTPEQRKFLNRPPDVSTTPSASSSRDTAQPHFPITTHVSKPPSPAKVPRLRIRKPESPSKYIQSEARKVSTELEKVMEEAFNRSSISSSVRTSATERHHDPFDFDTPPTSFSNQGSGGMFATPNEKSAMNRPLPPLPTETPNTFFQRELAQTRERLAARLAAEDGETTKDFSEILGQLDRLLQPQPLTQRTTSAPQKSPDHLGYLPIISESRAEEGDEGRRSVTDPLKGRPGLQGRATTDYISDYITDYTRTIRMVDPDSPSAVAPLNIRKKSGASVKSSEPLQDANGGPTVRWSGPTPMQRCDTPTPPSKATEGKEAIITKKRSWFRRHVSDKGPQGIEQQRHDTRLKIPEAWQGLDDRIKNVPTTPVLGPTEPAKTHAKKQSDNSSEFPTREEKKPSKPEGSMGRRGFLGLFGKKSKEDRNSAGSGMGFGRPGSNNSLTSCPFDLASEEGSSGRPVDYQRNWLTRFLNIKPASKTLCFQISRGRARQELVHLLRDWKRFGVRDVVFDRKTNVVNCRVDKTNHLKIKPVSLVVELFVVLQRGRRAQLCIARFTQTHGAASSFRKVVDIVEDVFKAKGVLIEDEAKKSEMAGILG